VFGRRMGSRKRTENSEEATQLFFSGRSGRSGSPRIRSSDTLQDDNSSHTRCPGGPVHSIAEVPSGHLWIANQNAACFICFKESGSTHPWGELGRKDYAHVLAADLHSAAYGSDSIIARRLLADGGVRASYSQPMAGEEWSTIYDSRHAVRFGRHRKWAEPNPGRTHSDAHQQERLPCDQSIGRSKMTITSCGSTRPAFGAHAQSELEAWPPTQPES